jgi:hypothetical protein
MWQVHQDGFIMDGDRVVGTMVAAGRGRWRVEILWSGPGGDIQYETDVHASALAFILGVEATTSRYRQVVTLKVRP